MFFPKRSIAANPEPTNCFKTQHFSSPRSHASCQCLVVFQVNTTGNLLFEMWGRRVFHGNGDKFSSL